MLKKLSNSCLLPKSDMTFRVTCQEQIRKADQPVSLQGRETRTCRERTGARVQLGALGMNRILETEGMRDDVDTPRSPNTPAHTSQAAVTLHATGQAIPTAWDALPFSFFANPKLLALGT